MIEAFGIGGDPGEGLIVGVYDTEEVFGAVCIAKVATEAAAFLFCDGDCFGIFPCFIAFFCAQGGIFAAPCADEVGGVVGVGGFVGNIEAEQANAVDDEDEPEESVGGHDFGSQLGLEETLYQFSF